MSAPSIQHLDWPPRPEKGAAVAWCFGDVDDHLRIIVLLAHAFASDIDPEVFSTCTTRSTPWRERIRAFEALLGGILTGDREGHRLYVVDPDALDVLPREGEEGEFWDDATARRERAELLDVLLRGAARGGVAFARPFPRLSLSSRMLDIDVQGQGDVPSSIPRRWLRVAGGLGARRLAELEEDPVAAVRAVIDALSPATMSAAMALAPVRLALHANGSCGPLPWGEGGVLTSARFRELTEAGLVLPLPAESDWVVSRLARHILEARHSEAAQRSHALLAQLEPEDIAHRLEVHHHAAAAGMIDRALKTAEFYGSDLRVVARSLSLQGAYERAADLFRVIVTTYDATDAYAWEYLGYNLARSSEAPSAQTLGEVGLAYRRAHRLAPSNPLYHGRLFGYLLQYEGATLDAADLHCASYRTLAGGNAKDMFGWQVVRGLRRAGRDAAAREFQARWAIAEPSTERATKHAFGCARGLIDMSRDFDEPVEDFEDA